MYKQGGITDEIGCTAVVIYDGLRGYRTGS